MPGGVTAAVSISMVGIFYFLYGGLDISAMPVCIPGVDACLLHGLIIIISAVFPLHHTQYVTL